MVYGTFPALLYADGLPLFLQLDVENGAVPYGVPYLNIHATPKGQKQHLDPRYDLYLAVLTRQPFRSHLGVETRMKF